MSSICHFAVIHINRLHTCLYDTVVPPNVNCGLNEHYAFNIDAVSHTTVGLLIS